MSLNQHRSSRRSGVGPVVLIASLLAAVAVGVLIARWVGPSLQPTLPVGYALPALRLQPLLPGTPPVKLDDLRGKVTVINYWGTWCPPCLEEFPHLMSLVKSYASRNDFRLLSVATGGDNEAALREEIAAFLRDRNENLLPVYHDPQNATRAGLKEAPVDAVPLTVVVDRDLNVAMVALGYTPAKFEELRLLVASLLQAKTP